MKLLIHGSTGRMGQILCRKAEQGYAGAELAACVSPEYPCNEGICYQTLDGCAGQVDCVVDFSNHAATMTLLDYCVRRGLPVVIATTGHTPEEKAAIAEAAGKIPVFFSYNMSIGIAALAELAKRAAAMFPNADIEIVEKHHNQKLDVPSGTALLLAERIREAREEAEFVVGRHENGKRKPSEIGIHSLRMGNEVGTHEIIIAAGSETLTLKHEAEDRSLFADGAMAAARWLCGRKPGLYDMRHMTA